MRVQLVQLKYILSYFIKILEFGNKKDQVYTCDIISYDINNVDIYYNNKP